MQKKIYFLLLFISVNSFAGPGISNDEQLQQLEARYNQTKLQMNRIYHRMQRGMPANEFQWFSTVQRKWIDYRNANCRYYGRSATGQIACLENMNVTRIKEMQEILRNYQ